MRQASLTRTIYATRPPNSSGTSNICLTAHIRVKLNQRLAHIHITLENLAAKDSRFNRDETNNSFTRAVMFTDPFNCSSDRKP